MYLKSANIHIYLFVYLLVFFFYQCSSQGCPERLDSQLSALQVMKTTAVPASSWSMHRQSTVGGPAGTLEQGIYQWHHATFIHGNFMSSCFTLAPSFFFIVIHSCLEHWFVSSVVWKNRDSVWIKHPAGCAPTLSTSLFSWWKDAGWGSCSSWPTNTWYRPRSSFISETLFLKIAPQGSPGSCGDLGETTHSDILCFDFLSFV